MSGPAVPADPAGTSSNPGPVLVVIPTYNERENLRLMTTRLRAVAPYAEVLIVDDASPDGTGRVAEVMASEDDQLHVLQRDGKRGLGAAYCAGFAWALRRQYGVVVEMDADGSHQPEELSRLLHALRHSDLVVGSRWVRGGRVVNWPRRRELLSRGGNTYARFALGIHVRDATGGFRAFRSHTLKEIGLDDVESQGYCFQVDLAVRTLQAGLRVVEVPITFVERTKGASKMNRGIVAEALWRVTVWGLRRRFAMIRPRRTVERR